MVASNEIKTLFTRSEWRRGCERAGQAPPLNGTTTLGRWLTRDPFGYSGGINLYGYVDSSPVGRFDQFGLAGTPAPASGSFVFAEQVTAQVLQVVKNNIAKLVDKLKQTVGLQFNYQVDKKASIWVKVRGTSSSPGPLWAFDPSAINTTGGWVIIGKGGSKTTGTLSLTPSIGGGTPSASGSFSFTPGSSGGFGGSATAGITTAGFSGSLSQSYSTTISGVQTNIKLLESLGAGGHWTINPSLMTQYPVSGAPLRLGLGAGASFPTVGIPPYVGAALAKYNINGYLSATAEGCGSSEGNGAASLGFGYKWKSAPQNYISIGVHISYNSSDTSGILSPNGMNIPPGAAVTGLLSLGF
jgi:hypothetical protein